MKICQLSLCKNLLSHFTNFWHYHRNDVDSTQKFDVHRNYVDYQAISKCICLDSNHMRWFFEKLHMF